MIRPELLRDIGDLANEELLFANQKFPLFSSSHEGYAVLKEEIEESEKEINSLAFGIKAIWGKIRKNENAFEIVKYTEEHAILAAAEAIQVVAMCRKYQDSLGVPSEK